MRAYSTQKRTLLRRPLILSKTPGVVKGRLPLKLYSGSDGMHVRTDENLQVFVPCGFCRPGANARGKTRENSKKRRSATFSTLSTDAASPSAVCFIKVFALAKYVRRLLKGRRRLRRRQCAWGRLHGLCRRGRACAEKPAGRVCRLIIRRRRRLRRFRRLFRRPYSRFYSCSRRRPCCSFRSSCRSFGRLCRRRNSRSHRRRCRKRLSRFNSWINGLRRLV